MASDFPWFSLVTWYIYVPWSSYIEYHGIMNGLWMNGLIGTSCFFTATEQGSMFTCGTYSSCQLVLATCGSGFGEIPLAKMELFFREILQLIPSPDVSHHRNHGPMVDVGKETTPSYGRSFRTGSISACFDTSVNDVDGLTKPCTSNLGWLKLASQPSQWGW